MKNTMKKISEVKISANELDEAKMIKAQSRAVYEQLVKNYSFKSVSKRAIARADFPERIDIEGKSVDAMIALGQRALLEGGSVFAYSDKKMIRALFIVDKKEKSFECKHAYISPSISSEDLLLIEKDVKRQIAMLVYYAQLENGFYMGKKAPRLQKKTCRLAWLKALLVALGVGACTYVVAKSIPGSILVAASQFVMWFSILKNTLILVEETEEENIWEVSKAA